MKRRGAHYLPLSDNQSKNPMRRFLFLGLVCLLLLGVITTAHRRRPICAGARGDWPSDHLWRDGGDQHGPRRADDARRLTTWAMQLLRTVISPLNRTVIMPEWVSGSLVVNDALSLTHNRMVALGSGVAGLAGVALSQLTNVGPNLGQNYIIDSFIVVFAGGRPPWPHSLYGRCHR